MWVFGDSPKILALKAGGDRWLGSPVRGTIYKYDFPFCEFHAVDCVVSFDTKIYIYNHDEIQFVFFCCICFWGRDQEAIAKSNILKLPTPMFYSKSTGLWAVTFRSLIDLELVFLLGKEESSFTCLHVDIQFSLIEDSFRPLNDLGTKREEYQKG